MPATLAFRSPGQGHGSIIKPMLGLGPISRFLIGFIFIFGLLIYPWPGWDEIYGQAFRTTGNAIFSSTHGNRVVRFEAFKQTQGLASLDSRIVLGNRALADASGHGPATMLGLDTRSIAWVPTALTIALIAATPVAWPRRLRALIIGLILIHAFILFSICIYIGNESTEVSLLTLSPFWKQIGDALEYTLITQMDVSFFVPVLIWILTVFRYDDFSSFFRVPSKTV